ITDKLNIKEVLEKVVKTLDNYEPRPQQFEMAEAIVKSFDKNKSLIIEAGTGSGKSFGYLVPIATSEYKVVVSTGTIALQEQLLHKDVPFVVDNYNTNLKYALAKGRGNYLCLMKFFETQRAIPPKSKEGSIIQKIEKQYLKGWKGDQAELDFIVQNLIWQEINSDKDDCINHKCQHFSECPFRLARAELSDADIIVANHALYFTDLAGGGTILPPHDYVIFDEAHHIKSVATRAFTITIGKWASTKLLQKIQKRISPVPHTITSNLTNIESDILSWLLSKGKDSFRIFPDSNFYSLVANEIDELKRLRNWLNELEIDHIELFDTDNKTLKMSHKDRLTSQASNLISRWEYFLEQDIIEDEDLRVNWAETNKHKLSFEINSAPIFVSNILKEHLWNKKPSILTSATLAVDKNCNYTKNQLGLNADELILDSPFSYANQSRLHLPRLKTLPNSQEYNSAISNLIIEILNITKGRSLVLFTSISAMKDVSSAVIERLEFPTKVQGDLPRKKLIEWFKEIDNSVLFATSTYWEGIDIPGEDLICVIIDKIPFSAPDDPIISATVDYMKSANKSWFMEYMLPEATLKLKQGFGRLIRSKNDTGMVSILDPRLLTKAYGQIILNSLPKSPIVNSLEEIEEFLGSI
ncbi:MAG: ATP-dependent DNA helicase, partial [Bacillota bacterium]